MDAKEIEMMKDGARRVQEFLAQRGVEVKHAVMLEALSAGFGSRNWRTVRDKLNAPGTKQVTLEDLEGQRWAVHGLYMDNNQRYTGYYKAANPLQAQMVAQVERAFAEDGARIIVTGVTDRLTGQGADEESYVHETSLLTVTEMLRTVAKVAAGLLGEPPSRGVDEADAWDQTKLAIELFENLLGPADKQGTWDQNYLCSQLHGIWNEVLPEEPDDVFDYTDSRGIEWEDIQASAELELLLNFIDAEAEGLTTEQKVACYQARAFIDYAADLLDYVFADALAQP